MLEDTKFTKMRHFMMFIKKSPWPVFARIGIMKMAGETGRI